MLVLPFLQSLPEIPPKGLSTMGHWRRLPAEIRQVILEMVAVEYSFKSGAYARAGYASVCREWHRSSNRETSGDLLSTKSAYLTLNGLSVPATDEITSGTCFFVSGLTSTTALFVSHKKTPKQLGSKTLLSPQSGSLWGTIRLPAPCFYC